MAKMVPFAGYSMPLSYGDVGQASEIFNGILSNVVAWQSSGSGLLGLGAKLYEKNSYVTGCQGILRKFSDAPKTAIFFAPERPCGASSSLHPTWTNSQHTGIDSENIDLIEPLRRRAPLLLDGRERLEVEYEIFLPPFYVRRVIRFKFGVEQAVGSQD
ncbi:hypothetical protein GGX14DRAFT_391063 [Mycena pura]|uniref:Uncharacterized protein n=1 Tax=Mycena pura TaxID=153505 RepID=A0AAD6VRC4_9AGAR|nr:hypothetical protein GGX14DRAFT_391063 [Mycena pura]